MPKTLGELEIVIKAKDETTGGVRGMAQSLQQMAKTATGAATSLDGVRKAFHVIAGGAIVAGLSRATAEFVKLSREGAQYERVASAFANQLLTTGEDATLSLSKLRAASRGTVSEMELMLSASKAMSLGVTRSAADVAKLVELSAALGRRTGLGQEQSLERLVVGIGRLSPRILDDLGIAVNLTQTYYEMYGKAASELTQYEKNQALLNRVLKDGEAILESYNGNLDDVASSYERVGAAWANLRAELGRTDVSQSLAKNLDFITETIGIDKLVDDARAGRISVEELTRSIKLLEKQVENRTFTEFWRDAAALSNPLYALGEPKATDDTFTKRIEELRRYLAIARLAELDAIKRETPLSRPRELDANREVERHAATLIEYSQRRAELEQQLQLAAISGDQARLANAQKLIQYWQEGARVIATAYNIQAEEIESPLLDTEKFVDSGTLSEVAKTLDVFAQAEARAEQQAALLESRLARVKKRLEDVKQPLYDILPGLQQGFEKLSFDFQVDNYGNESASNFVKQLQAQIEGQIYYLEMYESKWLDSAEVAVKAAAIYAQASQQLEGFTGEVDTTEFRGIGQEILALLPMLAEARAQFQLTGDSLGSDEQRQRVQFLTEMLHGLAVQYNENAALHDLPLIDTEAIRRGELAAYDASAALDILSQAQNETTTAAQIAAGALREEVDALGMLQNSMAGFKGQLLSTLAGLGDVFSVDQLMAMYEEGTIELTELAEGLAGVTDETRAYLEWSTGLSAVTRQYNDQANAIRGAASETENLASTVESKLKSAYQGLKGVVDSELKSSLGELSNIGVDPTKYFRDDAAAENARRLADIMVNGLKDQSWLEQFKNEVPAIWDQLSAAPNMQEAAARMLVEFQQGLRPELINFDTLKENIKQKIASQMQIDDLATKITNDLIIEMGAGKSDEIRRFVGEALGIAIEDSDAATNTALALLDQFTSSEFAELIKSAGETSAENWASSFLNTLPDYVAEVVQMLAQLVTPEVQKRLAETQDAVVPR